VSPAPAGPRLAAAYFDGRSARAQPVTLHIQGDTLHIEGTGVQVQLPARRVQWPERQRHGERQAHLPEGGLLSSPDAAAWDAWFAASQVRRESLTVRWMQSWRAALGALGLTIAVLAAGYVWGLPVAAKHVAALLPARVQQQIGDAAMDSFRDEWLLPSRLSPERQAALRSQFEQAVRRTPAFAAAPPAWTLHFHATPKHGMGANAFALPGGHIVVTDDLVALLDDRPDVLIGVLGHELGHVQHQHGMRSLVQVGALSAVAALVFGDISTLLTSAPVLLGHAAYSRDFEREADRSAARLMRANGWDPAAFGLLFERLRDEQAKRHKEQHKGRAGSKDGTQGGSPDDAKGGRPGDPKIEEKDDGKDGGFNLPIGLSTHPPDAERVRRMLEVAD
jgi:Zn-dependent protease with chaperone function